MSLYQFFASKEPLEEFSNEKVYFKGGKLYIFPGHLDIRKEESLYYPSQYTKLENITYLDWDMTEDNPQVDENMKALIAYIKMHLKKTYSIELWSTFLDYHTDITGYSIGQNELTSDILKAFLLQDGFEKTELLKIYREDFYRIVPNLTEMRILYE